MPTLTYTNSALSNPADNAEVEANFDDIKNLVNGGLDNENVAASAGIDTSKLSARDYEMLVSLSRYADSDGTTHVAPATSTTVPAAIMGLPGDASDGIAYTVLSGSYAVTGAGTASSTQFNIEFGYYSAGTWTQEGSDIVSTVTVSGGTERQSGQLTINSSSLSLSNSQQRFIALFISQVGTNALDGQGENVTATLKLRRTSGLRGT